MRKNSRYIVALIATIICALSVSCGSKQSQKSPEQLRADSIRMADSIKAARPITLKNKAIDGLTRYLKKQISSDPEVGKVLDVKDGYLSDSLFFSKAKVMVKNRYGANEQYDNLWFCVCRKDDNYYMIVWADDEYCQRGLDNIVGKDQCVVGGLGLGLYPDDMFPKLYKEVTDHWDMEKLINDF